MKKITTILLTILISGSIYGQLAIGIHKTGQSNCGEKNDVLTDTATKYGNSFSFAQTQNPFGDSSAWLDDYPRFQNYQARVTSSIDAPTYENDRYGSEMALFYWYNQNNPDSTFYFFKSCIGAASIILWLQDGDWRNTFYSGLYRYYSQLKFLGLSDSHDLRYLIHTHGETDADNVDRANAYKSNVLKFYHEYDSTIAVICNKLNIPVDTTYTVLLTDLQSPHDYDTTIQRIVNELSTENSWIEKVNVDPTWLGGDNLHYSVAGYIELGIREYETIDAIENP